jgi:hypothetical protein
VPSFSVDSTTSYKLEGMLEHLREEYAGQIDDERLAWLLEESVQQLAPSATVLDFLPLLAYRMTRERCAAIVSEPPCRILVSDLRIRAGADLLAS